MSARKNNKRKATDPRGSVGSVLKDSVLENVNTHLKHQKLSPMYVHVKGATTNLSEKNYTESLEYLKKCFYDARNEGRDLIVCWDGDKIKPGGFAWVLVLFARWLSENHSTNATNDVRFRYAQSSLTKYDSNDPIEGDEISENLKFQIVPIIDTDELQSKMRDVAEEMEINHDAVMRAVFHDKNYSEKSVDLSRSMSSNAAVEMRGKEVQNYRKYWDNDFGYLVLGVAFMRLTQSRRVLYVGGGAISLVERAIYGKTREYEIHQELIGDVTIGDVTIPWDFLLG
jgi:hypothetical protein